MSCSASSLSSDFLLCFHCSSTRALVYYHCYDCSPSSSSSCIDFTDFPNPIHGKYPLCQSCIRQFHKPKRFFHHRIICLTPSRLGISPFQCQQFLQLVISSNSPPTIPPSSLSTLDSSPPLFGHGFCSRCYFHLSSLYCETCERAFCEECENITHATIQDNISHNTVYFDSHKQLTTIQLSLEGRLISFVTDSSLTAYSGTIWEGNQLLALFIQQFKQNWEVLKTVKKENLEDKSDEINVSSIGWSGVRVIELGCGSAPLPSFQCALNGASLVISSDTVEDALEIAKQNYSTLKSQYPDRLSSVRYECLKYSFGDSLACLLPLLEDFTGFDLILGSYILYDPDSFPLLADSLDQLFTLQSSCIALFTSHDQQRDQRFCEILKTKGIEMDEWKLDKQSDESNNKKGRIMRFWKRKT
jgi:hypothetical protein